ncbi:hypothetical protein ACFJIV_08020 [Mucilaginibacter sp. UC70_90]
MSFLLILTLVIGGIRGDFAHSTRPINMVDAYKHITVPNQGDIVLNTPFAISGHWAPTTTNSSTGRMRLILKPTSNP